MSTTHPPYKSPNAQRFWFAPIASLTTATITLPLDMLKVQLQTERGGRTVFQLIKHILHEKGFFGLYVGYSALVVAQFVYAYTRFMLYEYLKFIFPQENLFHRILKGGISGGIAGVVGNPPGLVTVRMQNDAKLPMEERKQYKHVFHAFMVIIRDEGFFTLFTGALTGMYRGIGMTIGQLSTYDHMKALLLLMGFRDTVGTHLLSSMVAGAMATFLTHPIDVAKTRLMTSPAGTYTGLWHCFACIVIDGPSALLKGFPLAFIRILINTVLLFVFHEQLKIRWGIPPKSSSTEPPTDFTTFPTASPPSGE